MLDYESKDFIAMSAAGMDTKNSEIKPVEVKQTNKEQTLHLVVTTEGYDNTTNVFDLYTAVTGDNIKVQKVIEHYKWLQTEYVAKYTKLETLREELCSNNKDDHYDLRRNEQYNQALCLKESAYNSLERVTSCLISESSKAKFVSLDLIDQKFPFASAEPNFIRDVLRNIIAFYDDELTDYDQPETVDTKASTTGK